MNVIVVGAGIAGLSTAWSLVKAGHGVSIVEQGPIPNPLAASGDHHRIIRSAYRAGTGYARLAHEAHEAWEAVLPKPSAMAPVSRPGCGPRWPPHCRAEFVAVTGTCRDDQALAGLMRQEFLV